MASAAGTTLTLLLIFFTSSAINSVLTAPVALCSKPMDIAILVDKSGSIGRKVLESTKTVIEKIVDYFGMSDQGNHYAIMEFGKTPKILVNFNTFTGGEVKSANLKREIQKMNRIDWSGGSYIDRALLAANSQLFTVGAGMRPNATQVVFLMSDGVQTMDRETFMPLQTAAKGLRDKGVQFIALGISNDVNVIELADIAGLKNVYSVYNYQKAFDVFARQLCSNSTSTP